jgi:bifunctional DNA-binding transcriptional regulator/antitoxin component of YhaV-PrlF toxin-antitoxin module
LSQRETLDRRVNRANDDGSLKVTVPVAVVRELDLKPGDTLRFAVVTEDGRKVAKFRKLKVVVED